MSRVYKMSKFLLKLYVPDAHLINDLMISIYTDDFSIAYDITEFKSINGSEVEIIVPTGAVSNMNDGVLKYNATGYISGNSVLIERQSNYFLKNPTDYTSSDVVNFGTTFIDDGTGHMTLVSSDYGAEGFSEVTIDGREYGNLKYEEGKRDGASNTGAKLKQIYITENGTYYPTTGGETYMNMDGDDLFEFCWVNPEAAVEIRFKINGEGWIVGTEKCGIYARGDGYITLYWYNHYNTVPIDESEYHTIWMAPYNQKTYSMTIDGKGYGMVRRDGEYYGNYNYSIGGENTPHGNFNFVYAKFWESNQSYFDNEVPMFHVLPAADNQCKVSLWGDSFDRIYKNQGDGAYCTFHEGGFDGWNYVEVAVPQTGGSSNLGGLEIEWATNWNQNYFYPVDYGYDGFNSVSIDAERALSEKYRDGYNKGYNDASGSKSVFEELVVDNILSNIIGNSESFWSEVDENNKGTMTGIMYQIPYDKYTMQSPISFISVRREVGGEIGYNDSGIATGTVPGIGTTLVKPWEYTEGVSFSDVKIEPHLWFGGFRGGNVQYFADIFKDCPDSLTHMETLDELGKSVTAECLLDFTPSRLTDKSQSMIANTVYDFAKEGPNANGISTLRVILNDNASEETRNKWASKGWTVE